jgi:hypothetical protein
VVEDIVVEDWHGLAVHFDCIQSAIVEAIVEAVVYRHYSMVEADNCSSMMMIVVDTMSHVLGFDVVVYIGFDIGFVVVVVV